MATRMYRHFWQDGWRRCTDDLLFSKWGSIEIMDKVDPSARRTIPLPPYMASLLLNLIRINDTPPPKSQILHGKRIENDLTNWKPSSWVFFSPTAADGYIQEPREAHNRALQAAGIDHVIIHGLRRIFGTLSARKCIRLRQLDRGIPGITGVPHHRGSNRGHARPRAPRRSSERLDHRFGHERSHRDIGGNS